MDKKHIGLYTTIDRKPLYDRILGRFYYLEWSSPESLSLEEVLKEWKSGRVDVAILDDRCITSEEAQDLVISYGQLATSDYARLVLIFDGKRDSEDIFLYQLVSIADIKDMIITSLGHTLENDLIKRIERPARNMDVSHWKITDKKMLKKKKSKHSFFGNLFSRGSKSKKKVNVQIQEVPALPAFEDPSAFAQEPIVVEPVSAKPSEALSKDILNENIEPPRPLWQVDSHEVAPDESEFDITNYLPEYENNSFDLVDREISPTLESENQVPEVNEKPYVTSDFPQEEEQMNKEVHKMTPEDKNTSIGARNLWFGGDKKAQEVSHEESVSEHVIQVPVAKHVVCVGGARSGVGCTHTTFALAFEFARRGARVAVALYSKDTFERTCALFNGEENARKEFFAIENPFAIDVYQWEEERAHGDEYDVVVCDCGVVGYSDSDHNSPSRFFSRSKTPVLILGGSPWDMLTNQTIIERFDKTFLLNAAYFCFGASSALATNFVEFITTLTGGDDKAVRLRKLPYRSELFFETTDFSRNYSFITKPILEKLENITPDEFKQTPKSTRQNRNRSRRRKGQEHKDVQVAQSA